MRQANDNLPRAVGFALLAIVFVIAAMTGLAMTRFVSTGGIGWIALAAFGLLILIPAADGIISRS